MGDGAKMKRTCVLNLLSAMSVGGRSQSMGNKSIKFTKNNTNVIKSLHPCNL